MASALSDGSAARPNEGRFPGGSGLNDEPASQTQRPRFRLVRSRPRVSRCPGSYVRAQTGLELGPVVQYLECLFSLSIGAPKCSRPWATFDSRRFIVDPSV